MPSRKRGMTRRISVTLPEKLVSRISQYADADERDDFITEAIEDYLEYLDKETVREERQVKRRERLAQWANRLRNGGRNAADAFLP